MAERNLINTLVSIENIMGIYRNYEFLRRRVKYLVIIRVFVEICFILAVHAYFLKSVSGFNGVVVDKHGSTLFNFVYCYMSFSTVNIFATIGLSFFNSNNFKQFIINISAVHKLFEDDASYQKSLNYLYKRFYIAIALYTIAMISLALNFALDLPPMISSKVVALETTLQYIYECRFSYEHLIFFEFTEHISIPLGFLNEAVAETVKKINEKQGEMENDRELWGIRSNLEKWSKASQYLVAASERLGDCFGIQISIFICTTTVSYIISLYEAVYWIINQEISTATVESNLLYLIYYVLIKILVLGAGQQTLNEAKKLNRSVACLRCLLFASDEAAACARAAAGLSRRLRAAPLRVRLLSSLAVQMSLLTDILAVVVNYTIVLLQFNHVV